MSARKRVFIHPTRGARLVKVGFSWPAFFFSSLWAAVMGMWSPYFTALLLADILLWALSGVSEANGREVLAFIALVATLVYAIVRGRRGNKWLGAALLRKGYRELG